VPAFGGRLIIAPNCPGLLKGNMWNQLAMNPAALQFHGLGGAAGRAIGTAG
jgi:hypothetical protein